MEDPTFAVGLRSFWKGRVSEAVLLLASYYDQSALTDRDRWADRMSELLHALEASTTMSFMSRNWPMRTSRLNTIILLRNHGRWFQSVQRKHWETNTETAHRNTRPPDWSREESRPALVGGAYWTFSQRRFQNLNILISMIILEVRIVLYCLCKYFESLISQNNLSYVICISLQPEKV